MLQHNITVGCRDSGDAGRSAKKMKDRSQASESGLDGFEVFFLGGEYREFLKHVGDLIDQQD
ncbi:MAG: hypothetical protein IID44_05580 [Planctomycetes bacterium]|nr:hypothetical protein [Planctomycetota bacterium]